MTCYWEPGTQYTYGDIVQFEGHRYKVVQPHFSQPAWAPSVATSLWGRLDDQDDHCVQNAEDKGHNGQCTTNSQTTYMQAPQDKPNQDEKKTKWFDVSEERRHQLEVGGGLALAAGVIGGGLAAFKHHQKSAEEKKNHEWGLNNWAAEAQAHAAKCKRDGFNGPCTWIFTEGRNIPRNAILVGREKSWNLYICRAFFEGGIQVGKASEAFAKGAVIGYEHEEHHLPAYEVLVGDTERLKWVSVSGRLNVRALGYTPVEGGYENDHERTKLYIVKAFYHDAVHPGKTSEKLDGAYIPYGGKEVKVSEYQILCYL